MPKTKAEREVARNDIRLACEQDFFTFLRTMEPHMAYGEVHERMANRMGSDEGKSHKGFLIPRDHMKSSLAAKNCVWEITRKPYISIGYWSATEDLAQKMLGVIKTMMTSDVYRYFWPDMVNREERRREEWNAGSIKIDHPMRKEWGTADPTVKAMGMTSNTTGFHCMKSVLDDLVVPRNAYTKEGRSQVKAGYSQIASIETTNATSLVVGTRYHPDDIYSDMLDMTKDVHNDEGDIIDSTNVYDFTIEEVEKDGEFLWPRTLSTNGTWYGFNHNILSMKKAQYLDKTQFYAQYYNNTNDPSSNRLDRSKFQYYNPSLLVDAGGRLTYAGRKINIYAAIDFASSLSKTADFTAIVVIGIDSDSNIYVLDIERFKTGDVEEYFQKVLELHSKWGFSKLRTEVTVAQKVISNYLKKQANELGLSLLIDEHRPTRTQGSKEERIAAALEPRYKNGKVFHRKGGYTDVLEEELVLARPKHDDIKDCLAMAVEVAIAPAKTSGSGMDDYVAQWQERFKGGRFYRGVNRYGGNNARLSVG